MNIIIIPCDFCKEDVGPIICVFFSCHNTHKNQLCKNKYLNIHF